jgi:WD40 repeat protein
LPTGAGAGVSGHDGEVCATAYSPDSAFVLSGGWDGHVRLWEASSGVQVTSFRASDKPISACCMSLDGKRWLTGAMDGLLAAWDPVTQKRLSIFLAHTRPISSILYSPDGLVLATASWDRNVILWNMSKERDGRTLEGHADIVASCCFSPDGQTVLSWSHDKTLRLWNVAEGMSIRKLTGHLDRVTAAAISPDGLWAASCSRDGSIKLWNLEEEKEVASANAGADVRACFFLQDNQSLVSVDTHGRLVLLALPDLQERSDLITRLPVQCAQIAPSGKQIALGCDDGRVHFIGVEGFDGYPMLAMATPTPHKNGSALSRLFNRNHNSQAYSCTCPICRRTFELAGALPEHGSNCPHCQRSLRFRKLQPQMAVKH